MKPASFTYVRAVTLDEVLRKLQQWGEEAKVLAGGQSLMPLLNMRLAQPRYIIDVNGLPEMTGVDWSPETQTLTVGALTRHRELLQHPLIEAHAPLLSEAARYVGHLAIRSRGTLGGSVAHADPAAELPLVLTALGGTLIIQSVEGEHSLPIGDFFLGYYMTTLRPDELITAVKIPGLASNSGYAIAEFSRRQGDFALASAAAVVTVDERGTITTAQCAAGGVAPNAITCPTVNESLRGARNPEDFSQAAHQLENFIDPPDDVQASGDYRRHLAVEMMTQAIGLAYARAIGTKEAWA
ncbi:MAG: xanthine dehydrogenase family protein subunit M [Firmicutes bacterium]|nr:xanthine dehydrogenase family protein subunit M [Bacillota bacterium]MCL5971158.1 xanthine dehydrogenase family protein subunit M [Bacillota bacterium]